MIELKSVSKVHRMGPREVHSLHDVSLQIGHGEYVAIMGPSGSGKSSLMQLLGGLDTPTTGSIRFLGRDFHSMKDRQRALMRRREIGFVFQDSNLVGCLTAVENVALPLLLDGTPRVEALAMALQGLAGLGLDQRASHLPSQLSGGEIQRVAIARALSFQPSLLLCDEPTGSLDSASGLEVRSLLRSIPQIGSRSVVMVTHDPEAASDADRIIRIKDGRIVEIQRLKERHVCTISIAKSA
ncbi:MAG: ABC transporter ATP-binding protein [Planctomycetota bacterium]